MSISFAEAEEILRKAKDKAAIYTGPCSQCKWSSIGMLGLNCKNPLVKAQSFTISDAYDAERSARCEEQRNDQRPYLKFKALCGPEGSLFEPNFLERILEICERWTG